MPKYQPKPTMQDLARRRGQTPCQLADELGLQDRAAVARWCASEGLAEPDLLLLEEIEVRRTGRRAPRTVEQVKELLKDVELPSVLASDEPLPAKKAARKTVRKSDAPVAGAEPEKLGGGDPGAKRDQG